MSNVPMTKKQHYVPRYYLKNFTDRNGFLHVYQRDKLRFNKSRPEDICYKDFLYETRWEDADPRLGEFILPNQIEKSLSELESSHNALLKKIIMITCDPHNKNALICNSDEKKELALFTISMFIRNPWALSRFKFDVIPVGMMDNPEIRTIEQCLKHINVGKVEPVIKAGIKKALLTNAPGGMMTQIATQLQNLHMCFLVADDSSFVTSNFPVVFETYEIEEAHSVLSNVLIPLCPQVALQYSNDPVVKPYHNRCVLLKSKYVSTLNKHFTNGGIDQYRMIISHSDRFLHSLFA